MSALFVKIEQKDPHIRKHLPVIQIEKAKNFDVIVEDDVTFLIDGANRKLVLDADEVIAKDHITVPANRIVVFSSTHAALMDRLEITDKIVGVAWGNTYEWFIPSIKKGLDDGTIQDIGISNNPDYEKIVALNPDLVILNGGTGLWEKHAKKLDELGIPYVVNSEWLEDDPLGRFEWIKFFAILTNTEEKATKIYNIAKAETNTILEKTSSLESPKVLWAGIFQGTVFVPRSDSYVGAIIKEANGNYVFDDINGTGGAQINIEEMIYRGKEADVWIFSSDLINSTKDIISIHPLLKELRPVQNCNVYSFQPWYWQRLDKYEEFVKDVAAILHPQESSDYQLTQFRKVSCD
jgi:iron complex transport system substrate-binding protein